MLSDHEFQKYVHQHQLSKGAIEYINYVRSEEASRMVGVRAKRNISSWIASEKMGRTISTESRTAEKGFFLLSEFDERVLEIWDQPQPIKIKRMNKNNEITAASYTADFLLLTLDGPRVVEVKPENKIQEFYEKYPSDWRLTEDGGYEYIPAVEGVSRQSIWDI